MIRKHSSKRVEVVEEWVSLGYFGPMWLLGHSQEVLDCREMSILQRNRPKVRKRNINRLLVLSVLIASLPGYALAQVSSSGDACDLLLKEALHRHLAAKESPGRHYECEYAADTGGFFVLALHYRGKSRSSVVGSNLVGWYAFGKDDGRLYEWDMANQRHGGVIGQGLLAR